MSELIELARTIEKEYGKGIVQAGQSVVDRNKEVISFGPALDIVTGGVEEGWFIGTSGQPKTHKTTTILSFAARAQEKGRHVVFADVEGRMTAKHLKGIRGLKLDPKNFTYIASQKGKILTAQDHLSIAEHYLRNLPRCVYVFDSVSCLLDEKEYTGGLGTETRGGTSKLFSQFMRSNATSARTNGCIVFGVTHLIANTSGFGAKWNERASQMWHYQCDYQLKVITSKPWKAANKIIGGEINWLCKTTPRIGVIPGMSITSYIRYGVGIDELFELISFGIALGVLQKEGKSAWLTLPFIKGTPKLQGGEKVYEALLEHPEWAEELRKQVMAMAGGLSGTNSEGSEGSDS